MGYSANDTTNNLEKILTLQNAREIGLERSQVENHPYVIWWVMDKGYLVLPKGIRPKWFFVSVEEEIQP